MHTIFLVRAGFDLLVGFAFDSGRTSTSDKISDELESLAEYIESCVPDDSEDIIEETTLNSASLFKAMQCHSAFRIFLM